MNPPGSVLMQRLRDQRGGKCEKCGSRRRLQFAHRAPTKLMGRGRGSRERYYDIKKHPAAYILVCRQCHISVDFRGMDPWVAGSGAPRNEEGRSTPEQAVGYETMPLTGPPGA